MAEGDPYLLPSGEAEFQGTRRFQVLRRLGEGGMGVVYEALDRETGSRVAVKLLRSLAAEALLRFKHEFRSLSDIQHPNLVSLGELIEDGGRWFFTMEYVDGVDFLAHVRQSGPTHDEPTAPQPSTVVMPAPAFRLRFDEARLRAGLSQLARGLHSLHRSRLVHRDIKPSNILVDKSGRVTLLDFGLVTHFTRGAGETDSGNV